MSYFD